MPLQEGDGYRWLGKFSYCSCTTKRVVSPPPGLFNAPHLLADQACLANVLAFRPFSQKQLAQERVERLFLAAEFLASRAVLLVQGAQEPFQNQQRPLRGVRFACGSDENLRVFAPVCRVLGQRSGREDEWRGGQRREVAVEGCNRLWPVS